MKKKVLISIIILLTIAIGVTSGLLVKKYLSRDNTKIIDIGKLQYRDSKEKLKVYEKKDYKKFLEDFKNNKLDDVYVTKFLYDGVGTYKAYDLDDFVEKGNDLEVDEYDGTVINVKNIGNYEFVGELTGGMIAVNTNNLKGNIKLTFNSAKVDTDSKKVPALYVYNKNMLYTDCKVTVSAEDGTKNYLEGGKFKKVSLVPIEELSNYNDKYSGDLLNKYNTYTNYYGIYKKNAIKNILFATVTANRDDLQDGDPYYYYKGSGAISSDIDLEFKGSGYLEVTSKNKEGIETKGNLKFSGGIGDYVINAEDDCLNTTIDDTEMENARNDLAINVKSLIAKVDPEADEGDAIDSNGTLKINGGVIVALAKHGADSGLDSEKGTYINGGTVLATGSMMDPINENSKQKFVALTFNSNMEKDSLVTLLLNDEVVFAFKSDRVYNSLIFSSSKLRNNTYTLYKDGSIDGDNKAGLYTSGTYTKGTQLGYSSTGNNANGPGGGQPPADSNNGNQSAPPNNDNQTAPPEKPEGETPQGDPPEKPDGENGEAPEKPEGEAPQGGETPPQPPTDNGQPQADGGNIPSNKEFKITGIANYFKGIGNLVS